jgi:hypothetical protein
LLTVEQVTQFVDLSTQEAQVISQVIDVQVPFKLNLNYSIQDVHLEAVVEHVLQLLVQHE